jgi:hypothetical protein
MAKKKLPDAIPFDDEEKELVEPYQTRISSIMHRYSIGML